MKRPRLLGKESDHAVAEGLPTIRNAVAIARDHYVVIAFRIELDKRDFFDQPEIVEQTVHGASGSTAENVVDLRAESVASEVEAMRITTRFFMRLDYDDAPSGVGQTCRHGEPGHAGAHHEIVAVERIHLIMLAEVGRQIGPSCGSIPCASASGTNLTGQ